MAGDLVTLSLQEVDELARTALAACGAEGLQLDAATQSVVSAEAEGIRIVGLAFLPIYCDQLKAGKINGAAVPVISEIAPSRLNADARNGFAHAAFNEALDRWIAMTRRQGAAVLTISHSNSAGVAGWFSAKVAEAGFICLGFANSSPMMPPAGGNRAFFGTNPLTFAAPRSSGNPPLVIDMATSQVAYVAIRERAEQGRPIPPGWGLDRNCQPTTDPAEVINGGFVSPLGGTKGALLAMMVDVLAGGLAGPSFSCQATSIIDDKGGPLGIGQTFIAIDPATGAIGADFGQRLDAMLAAMAEAGGDRIPGESRARACRNAMANGVEVPAALIEEIRRYSRQG